MHKINLKYILNIVFTILHFTHIWLCPPRTQCVKWNAQNIEHTLRGSDGHGARATVMGLMLCSRAHQVMTFMANLRSLDRTITAPNRRTDMQLVIICFLEKLFTRLWLPTFNNTIVPKCDCLARGFSVCYSKAKYYYAHYSWESHEVRSMPYSDLILLYLMYGQSMALISFCVIQRIFIIQSSCYLFQFDTPGTWNWQG